MHTNACGSFIVHAHEVNEYFITYTNNYSRYGYVYFMYRKFDAIDIFKEFKVELEKQLGKHLKALQSY